MSNVKDQISNQIQNPNDRKYFDIRPFVIDLTFGFFKRVSRYVEIYFTKMSSLWEVIL